MTTLTLKPAERADGRAIVRVPPVADGPPILQGMTQDITSLWMNSDPARGVVFGARGPTRAALQYPVDPLGQPAARLVSAWVPGGGGRVNQANESMAASFVRWHAAQDAIIRLENDPDDDGGPGIDRTWDRGIDRELAAELFAEARERVGLVRGYDPAVGRQVLGVRHPDIAYGMSAGGTLVGHCGAPVCVGFSTTFGALTPSPPSWAGKWVLQVITEGDTKVPTEDQYKAGDIIREQARAYHQVVIPRDPSLRTMHAFHPQAAPEVWGKLTEWGLLR